MTILNRKISVEYLFRLLFHILFWGVWVVWPIINASLNDTERDRWYLAHIAPLSVTHVPQFFINTLVLMPYFLRKRGVGSYIFSVIILTFVFIIIQYLLKLGLWENGVDMNGHQVKLFEFKTMFPIMFVSAISTVYGLILFMADQEKLKQEEKQEKLQAELSFLRSQISPHFIFNVLNSIVYLIRTKSNAAEPVTIQLSELMRYMLYEADDVQVSLDKEINYLNNYIELQRVRFEEDVEINMKVEGNIGSQIIEPMLLIPFVENAFKHGVGMIDTPIIDVLVRCDENKLFYEVRNKIAPELAEDKDSSSGIGLKNVKRRLELLYADKHKLEIKKEDNWFIVSLFLQLKTIGS
ncbi:sensor histidine kinase [Emticicia agri]|uniref:GHKL domain-containing protein n=1 Tax=Emticicia agri TaxID=2492393 RepID=A0A4Q5LWN1_9BACT|nr:histidine kinase [Emticicia agri]RYU93995.1 GHKL domain-containing protein [Emticicia agri]